MISQEQRKTIETIIWRLNKSVIEQMKEIKIGFYSWKGEKDEKRN